MLDVRCEESSSGMALPLVMIFLAMLGIVAASTLHSAIAEYQMAGNDQFREAALQRALGLASRVAHDVNRFPLSSSLGVISCNYPIENSACVPASISALDPQSSNAKPSERIFYEVERLPPLLRRGFSLRERQHSASSSLAYDAALFEVRISVDGSAVNLGSAGVARGIVVLTASRPDRSAL